MPSTVSELLSRLTPELVEQEIDKLESDKVSINEEIKQLKFIRKMLQKGEGKPGRSPRRPRADSEEAQKDRDELAERLYDIVFQRGAIRIKDLAEVASVPWQRVARLCNGHAWFDKDEEGRLVISEHKASADGVSQ